LTDQERDYASIIGVIDRLGRPAGTSDLGKYRRRWLEYPLGQRVQAFAIVSRRVLAAMVRDGVLKATKTAKGALVYEPGANAERYRQTVSV